MPSATGMVTVDPVIVDKVVADAVVTAGTTPGRVAASVLGGVSGKGMDDGSCCDSLFGAADPVPSGTVTCGKVAVDDLFCVRFLLARFYATFEHWDLRVAP